MKKMIFPLLLALSTAASASECFTKVDTAPALDRVVQRLQSFINAEGMRGLVHFRIETFEWDRQACNQTEFLRAAADSNRDDENHVWEDFGIDTRRNVRDYTGSFYKDYAFADWFARPDVNAEKEIYNHIYAIIPSLARGWRYLYYTRTDGSSNSEVGAIVFSPDWDQQFKIYFLENN